MSCVLKIHLIVGIEAGFHIPLFDTKISCAKRERERCLRWELISEIFLFLYLSRHMSDRKVEKKKRVYWRHRNCSACLILFENDIKSHQYDIIHPTIPQCFCCYMNMIGDLITNNRS